MMHKREKLMAQNPVGAALERVGRLLSAIERRQDVRQILADHGAGRVSIAEGAGLYASALAAHARFCAYSFYPALRRELWLARHQQAAEAALAVAQRPSPTLTASGHLLAMPAPAALPLAHALGAPAASCRPSAAAEVIIHNPRTPERGAQELEANLRHQLANVNRSLARLRAQTAEMEELNQIQAEENEAIERWIDVRLEQRAALRAISNWVDDFASTVRDVFQARPEIIRELGLDDYEAGMLDRFCKILDDDLAFYDGYEEYMAAAGFEREDAGGASQSASAAGDAAASPGEDAIGEMI